MSTWGAILDDLLAKGVAAIPDLDAADVYRQQIALEAVKAYPFAMGYQITEAVEELDYLQEQRVNSFGLELVAKSEGEDGWTQEELYQATQDWRDAIHADPRLSSLVLTTVTSQIESFENPEQAAVQTVFTVVTRDVV